MDCTFTSEDKDWLKFVMKVHPEVQCLTPHWWSQYFAVIMPILLLYLSVPLCLFTRLGQLGPEHIWDGSLFTYRAFGSMYRKYRTGRWAYAYESIVLLRKCLVVGSVILLSSYPYRACMMFCLVLVGSVIIQLHAKPFEEIENNRLELIVLWSTTFVAATGILCFAPTASESKAVPEYIINFAAALDITIICVASVIIILVMLASSVAVLYEEEQKACEEKIMKSGKVFDTVFTGETVLGLFDTGECFRADQMIYVERPPSLLNACDALFPAILQDTNAHPMAAEEVITVTQWGHRDEIEYRGAKFKVTWVESPKLILTEPYDVSLEDVVIECNADGGAKIGGTVTLEDGTSFQNPNGGCLGAVVQTVFESAKEMEPAGSAFENPWEIIMDKEPFKVCTSLLLPSSLYLLLLLLCVGLLTTLLVSYKTFFLSFSLSLFVRTRFNVNSSACSSTESSSERSTRICSMRISMAGYSVSLSSGTPLLSLMSYGT
jgi:hypothetical protein